MVIDQCNLRIIILGRTKKIKQHLKGRIRRQKQWHLKMRELGET